MVQIVEEQLAFPSGTATAQLISVLHRMPPPDTSVRPRRGYRALDTEEAAQPEPATPIAEGEVVEVVDDREPEVVEQEGWAALIWSFLASGAMNVSCSHEL